MLRLVVIILVVAAGYAEAGELREFEKHVRTTDPSLRALIREAVAGSPAIRTLVARLERSDVIVYVTREYVMPSLLEGHVTFMATSGGVRYLNIRLAWDRPPRRLVSTLAHELQHAVEIADAPWVVDEASMAREYERVGEPSMLYGSVRTFETRAAVLAGQRAWREFEFGVTAD